MSTLYTIGHSTRSLDELVSALKAHGIETLVDIRAFPMSRRLPHFNREPLERTLAEHGIRYVWMKALGGYRKATGQESPHTALRNASFRNYADYTLTPEFERAVADLIEIGSASRTAYMCAERVYFRCHRMIVSDWLVARGHEVLHVDAEGPSRPHKLTPEARVVDGKMIYRGDNLF
ncbi:MAG TPA: DUF488 domain-containing protein [Terriglobales bacterium]